jgi:hypothetical protein
MKRFITLFSLVSIAAASIDAASLTEHTTDSLNCQKCIEGNLNPSKNIAFKHLDLGVTLGTGGIGLDLSTPVTSFLKLRAGVEYMPQFCVPMTFNLQSYSVTGGTSSNFERMQEMMYEFTGIEADETVKMKGKPDMVNFKCMFDFSPWSDKGWHFTVGLYYGSHRIASAENYTEEAATLLGVKMFNKMHDYFISEEYMDNPFPVLGYIDPDVGDAAKEKFINYGRIGVHVGDYKDTGTPYLMEPGEDGMVKVRAYVNRFKPYLGFGYGGAVSKDKRLNLSFDAGVIYWGTPKVLTHEGVDLINDLTNVNGKVGTYVDIFNAMKVYPEINFRISYTLF